MTDYISVSKYARINGKDPSIIRRLLIAGRLEGEKVGHQWIIKKGTPYPEDNRIISGKYIHFRKKLELNRNHELMDNIKLMVKELSDIYGPILYKIVLYGSYARCEQTEESDVDIAVILTAKPSKDVEESVSTCVAKYSLECNKVLSVIDIDYDMYHKWVGVQPFYTNIEKEGIELWKR